MNERRERRVGGLGWIAFAAVALLAPFALGADEARAQSGVGYLGVSTQELDDDLRDSYDYDGPGGLLVVSVEPNSPADRAGIRRGDVLVRYAGETVSTPEELTRLVRADDPGDRVQLTLWRNGDSRAAQVTLGSRAGTPGVPRDDRDDVEDDGRDDADDGPRWRGNDREFEMLMTRPRLGVEIENADDDQDGVGRGVRITSILDDTPAERAGLRTGDVIVELGDARIDDTEDLRRELQRRQSGPVDVTVRRGSSQRTVTVDLEERGPMSRRMTVRTPQGAPRGLSDARERELRRQIDELEHEIEELRRENERLRRELRR